MFKSIVDDVSVAILPILDAFVFSFYSFDISFKIMAVMQMPFEALATALFPTIVRTKNLILNQKVILIGFMLSLLLWAFAYWQAYFLMELHAAELIYLILKITQLV